MLPDDPRHGTHAGWSQHDREHDTPCEPCQEARRRYQRRRPHLHALGKPPRVPIGETVIAKLRQLEDAGFTDAQLTKAAGVAASSLRSYLRKGATTRVRRTTRDRLEQLNPQQHINNRLTHIGTVRRAQALARIGYSAQKLEPVAKLNADAIRLLQAGQAGQSSDTTRRKIADAYTQLAMRPLTPAHDRHVSRTINRAIREGCVPPMAWDNIDDPNEHPKGTDVGISADMNATRAYELEHLVLMGDNLEAAAKALGIRVDTIWTWCKRHDHLDLYERLAERSRTQDNQHTKGTAA